MSGRADCKAFRPWKKRSGKRLSEALAGGTLLIEYHGAVISVNPDVEVLFAASAPGTAIAATPGTAIAATPGTGYCRRRQKYLQKRLQRLHPRR